MAKGKKGGGQPQQSTRKGKRTEKDAARTKLRKLVRSFKSGQFSQARAVIKAHSVALRTHYASDLKAIEKALPAPQPTRKERARKRRANRAEELREAAIAVS